ncbi:MAG: glycoside hydrolase family 97 protein [Acidobacteriaceae bacterium]|nr:glycoside hydrolase family 97 protein [Acidobacteriaceae bacterium]
MRSPGFRHSSLCGLFVLSGSLLSRAEPLVLASPDGQIEISFQTHQRSGQLTYAVSFHGKPVLENSKLGLDIQDQPVLGNGVAISASTRAKIDESYTTPAGKANPVQNICNTVVIETQEPERPHRKLEIEARAYDDGVAFRYLIADQPLEKSVRIVNEKTEFVLPEDATAYPLILRNYQTSWEDNYRTVALSGIHPESLIAMPFLLQLPGKSFLAITEAHIENYSGMYLKHSATNPRALEARLSPRLDDPGISVSGESPLASPWRVILIGDTPGVLIQSNLVQNLNPPSAITDTSWIRPGKAAWDWWSGPYDQHVDFKVGKNTATAKHYIDFAAQAGFEYFLLDGGWAAHGTGPNSSGADITQAQPDIDLPELLRYAKSKNVRVWLWSHWTDVARQMDEAFPLYEQWGVAGVKVDFMDRDDQWMVAFFRRVAKKAAEHHLMIDFHGAFKPDGLERTYPNVLTREGVLGLEYNKWSARVTPDHNVMLAFTRLLAGPMDYTPGGFTNVRREEFIARNVHPMVMGTRAHQTALFVVFQSPFEMVSDFPEAYYGTKELPFLTAVPTTWDETRVLNAHVGDYITIARRRGKDWYVGSIAGSHGAELSIPLEFLGSGKFVAETWSDAPDADVYPEHTVVNKQNVDRSGVLKAKLVDGGGQAMRITPLE